MGSLGGVGWEEAGVAAKGRGADTSRRKGQGLWSRHNQVRVGPSTGAYLPCGLPAWCSLYAVAPQVII